MLRTSQTGPYSRLVPAEAYHIFFTDGYPCLNNCLPFFGHNCRKLQRNPLSLPDASSSTTADASARDAAAVIVAARGAGDGAGSADAREGVVECVANAAAIAKKTRVPLFAVPPISLTLIDAHLRTHLRLSSVSVVVVDSLEVHRGLVQFVERSFRVVGQIFFAEISAGSPIRELAQSGASDAPKKGRSSDGRLLRAKTLSVRLLLLCQDRMFPRSLITLLPSGKGRFTFDIVGENTSQCFHN